MLEQLQTGNVTIKAENQAIKNELNTVQIENQAIKTQLEGLRKTISTKGAGAEAFDTSNLSAGEYPYTLLVDGILVGSRKISIVR